MALVNCTALLSTTHDHKYCSALLMSHHLLSPQHGPYDVIVQSFPVHSSQHCLVSGVWCLVSSNVLHLFPKVTICHGGFVLCFTLLCQALLCSAVSDGAVM
jgi:hypothetical protein